MEGLLERARKNVADYPNRVTRLKESVTQELQSLQKLSEEYVAHIVAEIESTSRKGGTQLKLWYLEGVIVSGENLRGLRVKFESLEKEDLDLQIADRRALLKHALTVYTRVLFDAIKREFADFDVQSPDWTELEDAKLTISWEIKHE